MTDLTPPADDVREALDHLDALNESGRIQYADYVALHDMVSRIEVSPRGTVTDAEMEWEYGCRSSSHSGFMRSVATWDDEWTWRAHLSECVSPAPVICRAADEWDARS